MLNQIRVLHLLELHHIFAVNKKEVESQIARFRTMVIEAVSPQWTDVAPASRIRKIDKITGGIYKLVVGASIPETQANLEELRKAWETYPAGTVEFAEVLKAAGDGESKESK